MDDKHGADLKIKKITTKTFLNVSSLKLNLRHGATPLELLIVRDEIGE
jgi:hypothetical protein